MSGPRNKLLVADARQAVAGLPAGCADMVLTSPPYYRLRDYGVSQQLGLEATVDGWVEHLAGVMADVQRVLVPTGTLWLNLGDSYATHSKEGAGRKSLLLAPERLASRLVSDGWLLRNKIVWQKANPMPTSVRDRLACTWEVIYVFAKQSSYFFDLDSVRAPHLTQAPAAQPSPASATEDWRGPNSSSTTGLSALKARGQVGHPFGKNPGDVWRLASSNYRGRHHATFPLALAERAITAGAPEARCRRCLRPWRRTVLRATDGTARRMALGPSCACPTASERGLVLDPFIGAGTTALAAESLGRDWLGIEINPSFAGLTRQRLHEARAGPKAQSTRATN